MKKFAFIFFHIFLILFVVAVSIFTMYALDILFKIIGVIIMLIAVLSFFSGSYFVTGVFESIGIKWYATNLGEKAIISIVLLLLGAGCFAALDFYEFPDTIGSILVLICGFGIGYKMFNENEEGIFNLSDSTILLGKLVPVVYIIGAGLFMVFTIFKINAILSVICIVIGAVLHVFRLIAVCKEDIF